MFWQKVVVWADQMSQPNTIIDFFIYQQEQVLTSKSCDRHGGWIYAKRHVDVGLIFHSIDNVAGIPECMVQPGVTTYANDCLLLPRALKSNQCVHQTGVIDLRMASGVMSSSTRHEAWALVVFLAMVSRVAQMLPDRFQVCRWHHGRLNRASPAGCCGRCSPWPQKLRSTTANVQTCLFMPHRRVPSLVLSTSDRLRVGFIWSVHLSGHY